MKSWMLAVGLFGACVVSAGACTVGSGDGEDGGGGTSSSSRSSSSSSSSSSGGGTGGTGGGGECSAKADRADCQACCDTTYTLSADAESNLGTALILNCGCAASSVCNAECDTADQATDFCADDGTLNNVSNDACGECAFGQLLDATDSCVSGINDACNDDAGCLALLSCFDSCPD